LENSNSFPKRKKEKKEKRKKRKEEKRKKEKKKKKKIPVSIHNCIPILLGPK
jgi:hypothetical protein